MTYSFLSCNSQITTKQLRSINAKTSVFSICGTTSGNTSPLRPLALVHYINGIRSVTVEGTPRHYCSTQRVSTSSSNLESSTHVGQVRLTSHSCFSKVNRKVLIINYNSMKII